MAKTVTPSLTDLLVDWMKGKRYAIAAVYTSPVAAEALIEIWRTYYPAAYGPSLLVGVRDSDVYVRVSGTSDVMRLKVADPEFFEKMESVIDQKKGRRTID